MTRIVLATLGLEGAVKALQSTIPSIAFPSKPSLPFLISQKRSFFVLGTVKYWSKLIRGGVEFPLLENIQDSVWMTLDQLI